MGDPPGQTDHLYSDEAPIHQSMGNAPRPPSMPMLSVQKNMLSRRGCGAVRHSTTSPPSHRTALRCPCRGMPCLRAAIHRQGEDEIMLALHPCGKRVEERARVLTHALASTEPVSVRVSGWRRPSLVGRAPQGAPEERSPTHESRPMRLPHAARHKVTRRATCALFSLSRIRTSDTIVSFWS